MNTDPRGVKRGRCEACECDGYEYNTDRGPSCFYCLCAPTKHIRLDVSSAAADTSKYIVSDVVVTTPVNVATEFDFDNTSKIESVPGPSNMPTVLVENHSDVICSSSLLETVEAGIIPKKLPPEIEQALQKKNVTPKQRCKIVRILADRFFAEDLPSSSVDIVADIAVQKWSPLKAHFGKKSAALAQQIRRRLTKVRSNSKCHEKEIDIDTTEADLFNISEMQSEMKQKTPSCIKLKQFLTATRAVRKQDSSAMSAEKLLKKYPALKIEDLLLWEFTQILDITEIQMEERWQAFCDAMIIYLAETENYVLCRRTTDFITTKILLKLPKLLPSGKRTKENVKYVLQMFEENTAIEKTIPQATEPPRLIAIGSEESACFHCYVDGIPMFTTNKAVKAVILILATYWIFNIEFPAESRPSFLLLSSVLLKEKFSAKRLQKCGAVVGLLKQLKL